MHITPDDYQRIAHCFPKPRGKLTFDNLLVMNALLYVIENSCKWRRLPERFGNWHTIYTRVNRWAKAGVLERVFREMQSLCLISVKIESVSLDSTSIKVHPDGTGALKKTVRRPSASPAAGGAPSFTWLPEMPCSRSSSASRPGRTATPRGAGS